MDPKKKYFLFKQSKHFCSVPWNHFEVFSNGDIKTCSKGKTVGNVNHEAIEDILFNEEVKKIKRNLLDDKLDSNCVGCHLLRTNDEHLDLRNHYNPMFKNFEVNYEDLEYFKLHGIDLHWDNTCNFKCVYCNPLQSSLIAQEQNIAVNKSESANIEKIITMVVENQQDFKEIYFSGGEPLLIKHNVNLLSRLKRKDIPIRINSNISMANDKNAVFVELKQFKNVLWTISAESTEIRFEYIRSGGNWKTFLNNLDGIVGLGHQIRLNLVWFVASVSSMFDTIEFFNRNYNIKDFTVNQLSGHDYLRVRNVPEPVKHQAKQKLTRLLESGMIEPKTNSWYNIARCQRELDLPADNTQDYKTYFDHLDHLRGTNWRSIFPELV